MLSQFPLTSNSKGDVPFHSKAFDYSRTDYDALRDHLRDSNSFIASINLYFCIVLLVSNTRRPC